MAHALLEKFKHRFKELERFRPSFSSLTRTTTFRVALSFASFFFLFAILLLGYILFITVGLLSYEAERGAKRELADLVRIWDTRGVNYLNMAVIERASASSDNIYVLITPKGAVLSGNLDAVPMDLSKVRRPAANELFSNIETAVTHFEYTRADAEDQERTARGVFMAGPDGYGLFVGRDLGAGAVISKKVVNAVWTGSIAVLAFAIVGGYLAARGAARRVDELSKTARAVMGGNLSIRAPERTYKKGEGDEFDALTSDINAMLERTEKLVQSSRTIGDAIAHDLRSPLTRLRANLENAAHQSKSIDEYKDTIEETIEGLDRVTTTFNAVLRLSRLEAGQGANFAQTDLSEMLAELGEFYELSVEDKGLLFKTSIDKNLNLKVDKSLLTQAITNLLDNAIKFTNSGAIELSARKAKNQIEIAVKDTGIGIDEKDRENALKRFVRLDDARSTQGSGLGLSLAQAIAEVHKGKIILEDGLKTPNGFGICVKLVLPIL